MSKTDDEIREEDARDVEMERRCRRTGDISLVFESIEERRAQWREELTKMAPEIERLEAELDPAKAWANYSGLGLSMQEEVTAKLLECAYYHDENGAQNEALKEDSAIDDALIQKARDLLPKIEELWRLVLAGDDNPLKTRTTDDLMKVAVDILVDDSKKWLPIKEEHLKEKSLYNTAPDRAAPIFRRNLLKVILTSQGYSVGNIKQLLKDSKPTM